jgi:outer membrane protein assembly complex protein YaeT
VRIRVRRLLAISAIAVVALVLAALFALHTTTVQSRILAWSVSELEKRFDLNLTADVLDYNLFTRRVLLTNVRLAAKGHEDNPFFGSSRVSVRLPWVAYRGRLRFDEVIVDGGKVLITRDQEGISNLPPGRGRRDPNAPPRRVDVRGLVVRDLDFQYRDYRRDVEIHAPGVRTDLVYVMGEGAAGPFAIDRDLIVRVGKRRVVVAPVKGAMAFDGSNVTLDDVALKTREGTIIASGPIRRALDQPTLDLTLKGTVDIAEGVRWAPPPIPVSGTALLDGKMVGAPSQFVLDTKVTSRDMVVGRERGVRLTADARLTPNGIAVSRSVIEPPTGGRVQASLDMPFGSDSPWWVEAEYRGLDAASAFRLSNVDPLPFGAELGGTLRIEKPRGRGPFTLTIRNASAARDVRGTAPLQGNVDFTVSGDSWRAVQQHRIGGTSVDGTIGGRWIRGAVSQSTFGGNLTVRSSNVGEAARYAALFGLETPAIVRDSQGPLEATVRLDGRFNEPRFIGTATSPGLDVPSLGRAVFTTDFDASARALNATNIDAKIGAAQVRGEVLANFVTRALAGELRVDAPSARDLLSMLPEAFRLDGPLAATATLGGTVDKPDIAATVAGTGLTLAGQPIDTITGKARIIDGGVNIESFSVTQGDGVLRATGRYDFQSRNFTLDAQGQELTWQGTIARLGNAQARFALKFGASGPIDRPVGEGAIEFELTGGHAGAIIGKGTLNVRLNGDTALVTGHIPALGAFITANVVPRSPFPYDAVIVMNRIDLVPVIALSGLLEGHVTGTASLSASASGTFQNLAQSRVFVNLQEIDATSGGVPLRLASPARLQWNGEALTVDALDLVVGDGRLLATGTLGAGGVARWQSSFKGQIGDLLKIGRPFGVPAELDATGPVTIDWRSDGGLDKSTATMKLADGTLTWGAFPTVRDLAVDARFDGTTLSVAQFTGRWQGGGIEGTASIPRGVLEARTGPTPGAAAGKPGFARLRVVGMSEQALAPWLSASTLTRIGGRVSATLDAEITRPSLDGINATVTFDEGNFLVAGVQVHQTDASILTFRNGVLTADHVAFDAEGSELTVTGSARLVPTDKAALDFKLGGTADLRILSAFAPAIATAGTAKLNVGIGGTPADPVFSGRVDVVDAEVLVREPRIVISELNGTFALDGQRLLFDSFSGSANGGTILLDGGFLLKGATVAGGQLVIGINRAALEYPRGLQSEADAVLTLRPIGDDWTLTGDVRVERSLFAETINIAALAAARRSRAVPAVGERSWVDQLRLNLSVVTQEDLRVDNNYARLEAGAAITVRGTVDDPGLSGRVTLREGGEVYLAGNTFHLSRGSISFTNPNRLEPEFDIELRALVSGTDITLTLTGPMDRLQTEVRSSDPTVDSREAMAMLFGGFRGEDAVTLLSSELLGVTGRKIGLDALRVERGFDTEEFRADPGLIATETDPSTRLTLSKRVRPDVEIIFSQSLRESGGLSAVVSYKPRRNVELRAISRDNLDRAIALRHEITFGGPGTAETAAPPQPEVTSVTISGDPRRPIDELLAKVSLDKGERFDFHTWQRDMDTLRELYHDQSYYEVRIRGTRAVSEDDKTVALDYRIEPGPLAELILEGHPLESEIQRDLHEAWRRAIFDRFLLEDIESRVRRHLMEEKIIGSAVTASVASVTPARKQVRVVVTAGQPVSSRELRYTGHTAFDSGDLNDVVTEAGLDVDGWLNPGAIADTLEDYYRGQGYLSVDVEVGDPAVVGTTGVLPVTIEEGRRYVLEAIEFPGVHTDRQVDVARAANLELGMPFVAADLEAARRRIEDFYSRFGFNTSDVELTSAPHTDQGVVDVKFEVLEGPQQILREVTTEGATRTSQDVITRALRLEVGQPVDLGAWAQARKRMYDTNVFRQVDIEPLPLTPSPDESTGGVQPVRAIVRLIEYPVWRLRYGMQLNDESLGFEEPDGDSRQQNLGVLADIRNQNLFGWAITAGIAGRYEKDRQSASLFTSNSSFFGLPVRNNGFIFASRQRFRFEGDIAAITDRVGLTAEQRWRPFSGAETFYSYRFERSRTQNLTLPPDDPFAVPTIVHLSRLTGTMLVDRRDDPFNPTKGWFGSANWDQGITWLGSDSGNGKMLLQSSLFRTFGAVVLASRAQIGSSFGREALLFEQRFLSGGGTTVRGYAEDSLGPRDPFLGARGGDALLLFNQEARFPVRGWINGVAFLDAGNVFATRGDMSFSDLKVGYGIGLRLATPFAMLRLDFGVPASTVTPDAGRRGRWYIGIGHIF